MSPQQIRATLKGIHKRKNKEQLHVFIKIFFGISIPRNAVCSNHQAPFDFFCDVFFEKHADFIALANRNGGKTLIFALLNALFSILYDDCESSTAAAIVRQAQKCYKYFKKFLVNNKYLSSYVERSIQTETSLTNGSSTQVLVGTISGVNSPHPHKNQLDEVDLMDWNVLQEAFSMSKSDEGIPGQNILASTRKSVTGPMSKLLDEGARLGFKSYEWCIWEVIEPLPDKNSMLYKEITAEFGKELPKNIAKSDGFYKWTDAIGKHRKLDPNIWDAQWTCKKPDVRGLVYETFQDISYPDGNIRDWSYTPGMDFYLLEDFGFGEGHPDVVLFVQVNWELKRMMIFDELYLQQNTARDVCDAVAEKMRAWGMDVKLITDVEGNSYYNFGDFVTGWITDPSNLTNREDRRRLGAPIWQRLSKKDLYIVQNGISLLRRMFKDKKILIAPRCVNLRGEYNSYRKKRLPNGDYSDSPEKKNDHGPDGTRYGAIHLFPVEAYEAFGVELDEEEESLNRPITGGLMEKEF